MQGGQGSSAMGVEVRMTLAGRLMVAAALLALGCPAHATVVGGGGSATKDCLVALDAAVNFPVAKPRHVRCADGDPTCDDDGVVNGVCDFRIAVCANSTYSSACTLNGVQDITVDHAEDNSNDPKFDPDFQAVQNRVDSDLTLPTIASDDCTNSTIIQVRIKGPLGNSCGKASKRLKLTSRSTLMSGSVVTDRDVMKLTCEPAAGNGCDPHQLFTGTFDRIQKQIFNQSCAVSGCHDSQAQSGNLLLETGASHGNLLNQTPSNFAAAGAGWKRMDVVPNVSGDPSTSFIYRKISGDLPDFTYGGRMPLGRPQLHKTLREIIRLWIEAGAPPSDTWVPGTD